MPVILNEKEYAEQIIEKGEVGNKPTSTLFLLSKYYRQEKKLSERKTAEKLNEFMKQNYKGYNEALWEDIIEDISKKGKKYLIQEIKSIDITQKELDEISKLTNMKYEKLLFTMLCYAKLYNTLSETNNGWINTDIKEIYKSARVTVKYRNDKFLYLNDLEETGLISFSNKNDNLNMRINFIDNDSDVVLKITDFRELGYEYQNYIGDGKFIRCSECGRIVRKNGKSDKYCSNCAKEKQLQWQRESMSKLRNSKCEVS